MIVELLFFVLCLSLSFYLVFCDLFMRACGHVGVIYWLRSEHGCRTAGLGLTHSNGRRESEYE